MPSSQAILCLSLGFHDVLSGVCKVVIGGHMLFMFVVIGVVGFILALKYAFITLSLAF